jgi:hypothetical protein
MTKSMKKALVFLIISCTFFGCVATFNPALLQSTNGSINPLLPRLKMQQNAAQITSATGKQVTSNTYMYTIFDREMENICQQKGDIKGTIEPIITINTQEMGGWGYFAISSCTCYIINLLGFPLGTMKYQLEVEFEIRDQNGDRVWKKTYDDKETVTTRLYKKETRGDEQVLIMYRKMILDFKRDLQNDVKLVSDKLSK